ncbi:dynamin family protein [Campylobacter ureolyticus]|uniref:dynamin family protein n=1 Tax=Campylobacter ureolyticus TaxID=827 RepID=UPI0022B2AE9D|nr:dynamin family protein [Campylobacter ureolyticus]MCZ6150382.1 dynamin family protein [Campylobacter ureolyticus]
MKTKNILEQNINALKKYFEKYKNKEKEHELNKIISDLKNQKYKIAVVANMSAGKSTFINALFGDDVLPAYNQATTDCATFICSKKGVSKKAVITFSDNKPKIEIVENLEQEIKQYAQKDEDCKDDKYKNVEKIELYYPFKNIRTDINDELEIIFIDTPGPNSTGDEYKEKHKDQTRSVLNEANLALFLFDYGQIDANLRSDGQGLWNTIKEKHSKDKFFEVYFIINKIDMAFEDNFKDLSYIQDKEEFIRVKRQNWFKHENLAIEKIKIAAQKHGIQNPIIYTASSKFELLNRDITKSFDDDDELEEFKRKHFIRIFKNEWEEKFIDYLGFEKLEKDINNLIQDKFLSNFLENINFKIKSILNEEKSDLLKNILVLKKPKQEGELRLKNAMDFLENGAKILENKLYDNLKKKENKAIEEIEYSIEKRAKDEIIDQIDVIAKKSIAYSIELASGADTTSAKRTAERNFRKINLGKDQIELSHKINVEDVMYSMQKYAGSLINDCKNDYLDIKTDIDNIYFELNRALTNEIEMVKLELNKQLEKDLDITIGEIYLPKLDIVTSTNAEIKIPSSTISYEYQSAKYSTVSDSIWYKPWTWGRKKTIMVENEKHTMQISGYELKEILSQNMQKGVDELIEKERKIHIETIKNYVDSSNGIFVEFRRNKLRDMDKLKIDIQNSEKNLSINQTKLDYLEKIEKEIK